MKKKEYLGLCFAILSALSYSIMTSFVKISKEVPFEVLVFFRSFFCLIAIIPILIQKKISIKTKYPKLHLLRVFTGVSSLYALFYAARHLFLVDVILLANTAPLFIPLVILVWKRKKLSFQKIISIFCGFLGILLILKPNFHFFNIAGSLGLMAGFFMGITFVTIREIGKNESPYVIMFYFFLFSVISALIPMIYKFSFTYSLLTWLKLLCLGIFGLSYQFFNTTAYSYAPPSKVGCLTFSAIIFASIIGYFKFSEKPDAFAIIGACLIISASIFTILYKEKSIFIKGN